FVKVSGEELAIFFKSSIGFAVTGPYVKLGLGASLLWASLLIRAQGGGTPDLVFFSGFLYLFLEPVMFMSWVAVVMSQGLAAWKRVKELHGELIEPSKLEQELSDVSFETNDLEQMTALTLWDRVVPLKLKKGQWTVVVGETGS